MVDAAKEWDADHPDVEVVFAQGKSGTDDEGEIAAIESMITQGVKAIAITPTSPNVQAALDKAVDGGHQGRPRRQRHPRLDRQVVGRRHRQPRRRQARRAPGSRTTCRPAPSSRSSRAGSATPSLEDRVTGMLDTLGDRRDGRRREPGDGLRPDQGPGRRARTS